MDEEESFNEFLKAQRALRDILFLYKTFTDYAGLHDDLSTWEFGEFDPFYFIDWNRLPEEVFGSDLNLLHVGSALLLFCEVLQAWSQGGYPETVHPYVSRIKELLVQKRLEHIPQLRDAVSIALESESEAQLIQSELYKKYVLGYFLELTYEPNT